MVMGIVQYGDEWPAHFKLSPGVRQETDLRTPVRTARLCDGPGSRGTDPHIVAAEGTARAETLKGSSAAPSRLRAGSLVAGAHHPLAGRSSGGSRRSAFHQGQREQAVFRRPRAKPSPF